MAKIYFHGNREQAKQVAIKLRDTLTGGSPDPRGIAKGVFLTLGFLALTDIKDDFIRKASGGTGEDGAKWPPLSREYLAYGRRFGPGEQKKLKDAAGLGRQHRHAPGDKKGLLTAPQLKRWRKLYATYLNRLLLSLPPKEAASRAAQFAWVDIKKEGAQTKINVFGGRTVQILRDTGILLNSLSPGKITGGDQKEYQKPGRDGGEEQIFETIRNGVVVGTNVPYAAIHNYGQPGKMPKRQFIPEVVPQVWLDRWAAGAEQALLEAAKLAYGSAA